jgi:hypothetical protein
MKKQQSQIAGPKKTQTGEQTDFALSEQDRNKESSLRKALKRLEKYEDKRWADTLELNSAKADDEVRRFLDERGVHLKTVRSVKENILRTLQTMATRYGNARPFVILGKKHKETGEEIYKIPRFVLDKVVECKKELRREQKLKYWHTRKGGK